MFDKLTLGMLNPYYPWVAFHRRPFYFEQRHGKRTGRILLSTWLWDFGDVKGVVTYQECLGAGRN